MILQLFKRLYDTAFTRMCIRLARRRRKFWALKVFFLKLWERESKREKFSMRVYTFPTAFSRHKEKRVTKFLLLRLMMKIAFLRKLFSLPAFLSFPATPLTSFFAALFWAKYRLSVVRMWNILLHVRFHLFMFFSSSSSFTLHIIPNTKTSKTSNVRCKDKDFFA